MKNYLVQIIGMIGVGLSVNFINEIRLLLFLILWVISWQIYNYGYRKSISSKPEDKGL